MSGVKATFFVYLLKQVNMKEILLHNFSELNLIVGLFASIFLYTVINIGYWIKRLLRIKLTREVKILDCMPCFCFWCTLLITLSPVCAMASWVLVQLTSKKD